MKRNCIPARGLSLLPPQPSNVILRILMPVICIVLTGTAATAQLNQWTWKHGPAAVNQHASYGTLGVSSATNIPGPRNNAVTWVDASGCLWLFGGNRFSPGYLDSLRNDMWRWNGSQWTWMGGTSNSNDPGVHGTKGVAAPGNLPSSRSTAVSWTDASGNFWLHSGYGIGNIGVLVWGRLNDLWKWDGINWTWVKGSEAANQLANYGTKGVAAATNNPSGKNYSVAWKDASGNAWVFGGFGYNPSGSLRHQNELWKWDGTNWTWVSGSSAGNQPGIYGTKGIAAATNVPGGRIGSVAWNDAAGNGWVYGGLGYDSAGTIGYLNDLWKWDGTYWTWMGGSKTANRAGIYGTAGVTASTNWPGSRVYAVSWKDNNGHVWMMGGRGHDIALTFGSLNDIWKWDGTNWTWLSGSNTANPLGNYGTINVSAAANTPGGKERPAVWRDYNNAVWLFGGNGYGASGGQGYMNDMWRYTLHAAPLPLQLLSFTGEIKNNHTLLHWKITGDDGDTRYTVERSFDGRSFIPIGSVAGNGNQQHAYHYTDTNGAVQPKIYYRLKIAEHATRISYSNILLLQNSPRQQALVYPNPVRSVATVYLPADMPKGGYAILYSSAGKEILRLAINGQYLLLDMSHLPSGQYYLKLGEGKAIAVVKR